MDHPVGDPFSYFWSKGYHDLLPVIPANATGVNSPGKCPGVKMPDGTWQGRDRKAFVASEELIRTWKQWGAGVGIRCYNGIVAIDIDTLSEEWSKKASEIVDRVLGHSAVRIGQYPKILLVFRASVATRYRQIRFQDGVNPKGALVELLAGANCWFVAHGIHPKTGELYRWPEGIPAVNDLTFVSAEKLEELFDELKAVLPASKLSGTGGIRGDVDQAILAAEDPYLIIHAFKFIKNDFSKIGYNQWVEMAVALRAALPNDPGTAESLFVEWSEGYVNPKCSAYKTFWSVNPPFKLGAQYIFDKAAEGGWDISHRWFDKSVQERVETGPAPKTPGTANASQTGAWGTQGTVLEVDEDFDGPPPPPDDDDSEDGPPPPPYASPFDNIDGDTDDKPRTWKITPARYPLPASIEPREWLYGRFLIRKRVALTVAPSETGKTGLGLVDALAMASGKSLLGAHPFGALRVAVWNGEDPLEELERRVAATMQLYGLTEADMGGRLFLDSGFSGGQEMEIAASDRTGLTINRPQIRAFSETIKANQIDVQILDPFVGTHGVGENDNNAIDRVAKLFARVADETNCAVHLFHHTRKGSGGQHDMTVDDARGAGALGAAVRSRRALQTMQPDEAMELNVEPQRRRFYFRVADTGTNMAAPDEETTWFEMRNVLLPNGRPTPGRPGDEIGVPIRWKPDVKPILPADVIDRILAEVDTKQWRPAVQSVHWTGHLIAREHGLDVSDANVKKFIKLTIAKMMSEGILTTATGKDERGRDVVIHARGQAKNVFV